MKKIILLASIIILLIGCNSNGIETEYVDGVLVVHNPEQGLWQDDPKQPISFELEQTIGAENEPPEELFSGISDVFSDKEGNIYIFDYQQERLTAFDSTGNVLWNREKQGQAPGEFNGVYGIVYDGDESIFVCNNSGFRIDQFDLNGNYITNYNLSSLDLGMLIMEAFVTPDLFVFEKVIQGSASTHIILVEIGDTLTVSGELRVPDEVGIEVPPYAGISRDINAMDNEIVLGGIAEYTLQYYNSGGEILKRVTRDIVNLVDSELAKNNFRSLGRLFAPIDLNDEYALCFSYWPVGKSVTDDGDGSSTNPFAPDPNIEFRSMIDLINNDGEILYSYYYDQRSPDIGRIVYADSFGKLYTVVSEPYPQVRRYAVHINK